MSRLIVKLICSVFLLVQVSQSVAQTLNNPLSGAADSRAVSGIDLDPPQVDHIPVVSGVAGAAQSLTVRAADVQGIASVTLLHRSSVEAEYKQILMRPVYGTDNYIVSIDTFADQQFIDYYFLVIDTGGNKVLNGFPYEPFTRALAAPSAAIKDVSESGAVPIAESSAASENTENTVSSGQVAAGVSTGENKTDRGKTNLWAVLGVLALGAIAASSGGGGDATGESGNTVPVILSVPLP